MKDAVNWEPLEKLVGFSEAGNFMYMGTASTQPGIHMYKHIDTRRYLNIDGIGRTWAYTPNGDKYVQISNDDAKLRVAA